MERKPLCLCFAAYRSCQPRPPMPMLLPVPGADAAAAADAMLPPMPAADDANAAADACRNWCRHRYRYRCRSPQQDAQTTRRSEPLARGPSRALPRLAGPGALMNSARGPALPAKQAVRYGSVGSYSACMLPEAATCPGAEPISRKYRRSRERCPPAVPTLPSCSCGRR